MDYYLMRLDVDVVLIITPKHKKVTQVFKDSIGIWVVVGCCWIIVKKILNKNVMMQNLSFSGVLDAVGDGAHKRGWNMNQQIVK